MRPVFDAEDQKILDETYKARRALYAATEYPILGDAIVYPDGSIRRVAHTYKDTLQPTSKGGGSFFVFRSGEMQFSGGLDSPIKIDKLSPSGCAWVPVWFFHHGIAGPSRGVDCTLEVRRWRYDPT